MAGIFAATWLTTRFLARRLPGGGGKGSQMQVVERLPLGKDRQVALLRVGSEHYLVGISGQQISFSQQVRLAAQDGQDTLTFAEVLEKGES